MFILVLGGEGMLGHKMFQVLRKRYPDTSCSVLGRLDDPFYSKIDIYRHGYVYERVDATNIADLEKKLCEWRPAFIVNCIGIVKQRSEANAPIPSITLNSLLPHKLAQIAAQWNGRVIHFSTDCVFSGLHGSYTENDHSDAQDLYGKSKFLGELIDDNALTLRTSIIGRELSQFRSLLEWFLAQRGKCVHGYRKALYSGVTTNHLSELVADLIADYPTLSGLYQLTGRTISKYELLCLLRDAYDMDTQIVPDDEECCDRSMIGDKFRSATGYVAPPWSELISEMAGDPTPYEDWRNR
ncbi:SDR family oxidoreductase [bacterium]|nr:SDR family oxidoreductase [bacterium]